MADRVRRVQGLRSSGAAGPHGRRPTRAEQLADALDAEEEPCLCGTAFTCLADHEPESGR